MVLHKSLDGSLISLAEIPKSRGRYQGNYREQLEEHYKDGFRPLLIPETDPEIEALGEIIPHPTSTPTKEVFTYSVVQFTQEQLDQRDLSALKTAFNSELALGVEVENEGQTFWFDKQSLNDFITQKNEVALIGIPAVDWPTNKGVWLSLEIARATTIGLTAMQIFSNLYKNRGY